MTDFLTKGAAELAQIIRNRKMSALDVVNMHIARIERINPFINALTSDRFDGARAEARRADELIRGTPDSSSLPPLLGVPCTIKEYIAVEGMPHTGGILARLNVCAENDATTVARIRDAGGIILGTSNAPEGGLSMETHNLIHGRTSNPHDLRHTPGGSSGGEGALIASGGSPFGLGADVGGSIRIPAAFCGIAGHKPTGGLVPTTGHYPPASGDAGAFLTIGPMARTVADLRLLMKILQGPDGIDLACTRYLKSFQPDIDPKSLTVYPVTRFGRRSIHGELRAAIEDATRSLEERGATVIHHQFKHLEKGFEIWSAALAQASKESYESILSGGQSIAFAREFMKLPFGRARHTLPALTVSLAEKLTERFEGSLRKYLELGDSIRETFVDTLGPNGVLLYPTYPKPAPRHHFALIRPRLTGCTSLFNILQFPSTVVPIRKSKKGLPLSVQIIGLMERDALTLQVGEMLEDSFGCYEPADPTPDDA